jgi:hypothetical protein
MELGKVLLVLVVLLAIVGGVLLIAGRTVCHWGDCREILRIGARMCRSIAL